MSRKLLSIALATFVGLVSLPQVGSATNVNIKPSVFSQGQVTVMPFDVKEPIDAVLQHPVKLKTSGEDVKVKRAGSISWQDATDDMALNSQDSVKTGDQSTAAIHFQNSAQVFLAPNTTLVVEQALSNQDKKTTILSLEMGRVMANVQKLSDNDAFEIRTPTAVSAVRGTTFYLSVALLAGIQKLVSSDLYVDGGAVDFIPNDDPLTNFIVEKMFGASIQSDGTVLKKRPFTPNQRKQLVDIFETIHSNLGNPQFGLEQILGEVIPALVTVTQEYNVPLPEEVVDPNDPLNFPGLNGALLGTLQTNALLLANGIPNSGNFNYLLISSKGLEDASNPLGFINQNLGIVSNDRIPLVAAINNTGNFRQARQPFSQLVALRNQERLALRASIRSKMRDVIDAIQENQQELSDDAVIARINDRQTGKVFTDIHGNRVRTDQYIFHDPNSDSVEVLSLTLRTDSPNAALNGISSFRYGVTFNTNIPADTALRDLNWGDFLNVVSPQEWKNEFPRYNLNRYESLKGATEYIVHEATGQTEPGLYPKTFKASFSNPAGDAVSFANDFFSPVEVSIGSEEEDSLWLQGDDTESRTIGVHLAGQENPEPIVKVVGTKYNGFQTDGLTNEDALGFNNPFIDSEDHPFHIVEGLDVSTGEKKKTERKYLLIAAVPIDNQGQVVDAEGFGLYGPRDFITPNTLVNEGKYNLEVVLQYGTKTSGEDEEPIFNPQFTIDTIITPELFFSVDTLNSSELFPDTLGPTEKGDGDGDGCEYCED